MLITPRYILICIKRYGLILILSGIIILSFLNFLDRRTGNIHATLPTSKNSDELVKESSSFKSSGLESSMSKLPSEAQVKLQSIRNKAERLSKIVKRSNLAKLMYAMPLKNPNYNVHIFYYPWYGNLQYDKTWKHWNHEYLPNWKKEDTKVYPIGRHNPPDDIGSNYYPALGCYSSKDPEVIDIHMKQIREAGIGVLIVSWYPPQEKDASDELFLMLLEAAKKFELHVAPHLEPYEGRNITNLRTHIQYFIDKFGYHESLHRMPMNGKNLPVFYVYDSYQIENSEWKELLDKNGKLSLRSTDYDGVYFGLVVDMQHRNDIKTSHFDGFYTYFASNGFSYGSSWKNWQILGNFAKEQKLLFSPSVGPGYIDVTVRPWNAANTRHRRHGHYYEVAWRAALSSTPAVISITSFNEWHEGTQIEPAVMKRTDTFNYLDYEPEGPYFYLNLTSYWVRKYTNKDSNEISLL